MLIFHKIRKLTSQPIFSTKREDFFRNFDAKVYLLSQAPFQVNKKYEIQSSLLPKLMDKLYYADIFQVYF